MIGGYFTIVSEEFETYRMPWRKLPVVKPQPLAQWKPMPSPAKEIYDEVITYYRARGQDVPPEDVKACIEMIKAEKVAVADEIVPPPKPAYGTPEFWKAHWEKKKAARWKPKATS